jgi:hypothetical protein
MTLVAWVTFALFIGLFAALLACLEIGYRIGRNRAQKDPELAFEGIAPGGRVTSRKS